MIGFKRWFVYLMATLWVFTSELSWAEETIYKVIVQKQQAKINSRWTLEGWLAQKDRNRMMDYWLAMNSSDNPFEFSFAYTTGWSDVVRPDGVTVFDGLEKTEQISIMAFASIAGLNGHYVRVGESITGADASFQIRVLGRSQQNTHLTLEYGLWNRQMDVFGESNNAFSTDYYGVSLSIYLMKYFGLSGRHQHLNKKIGGGKGIEGGMRSEAEVFIDFGALRVFGQHYSEKVEIVDGVNAPAQLEHSSLLAGVRFFF